MTQTYPTLQALAMFAHGAGCKRFMAAIDNLPDREGLRVGRMIIATAHGNTVHAAAFRSLTFNPHARDPDGGPHDFEYALSQSLALSRHAIAVLTSWGFEVRDVTCEDPPNFGPLEWADTESVLDARLSVPPWAKRGNDATS